MSIQSRFTSSTTVAFEFQRTEALANQPTLFVSQVAINLASAPTAQGEIEIFLSDHEGEDLIWEAEAMSKTHVSYSPKLHLPVTRDAKLILRYANADSVEVTARFLWRV